MSETNSASTRTTDTKLCDIVNEYLDKNLYSESKFKNAVRETTKERQLLGVDIEFDLYGEHFICDEKAATDYINKSNPLKTYCLELSSLQGDDKKLCEGWFTKEDNINDSYMFVWVDRAKTDTLSGGCNDITGCEAILVKKENIVNYLEQKGWTIEKLRQKAYDIRYNGDKDFGNLYRDGYKFSFSEKLYEQPINILLLRDTYRNISSNDYNKYD